MFKLYLAISLVGLANRNQIFAIFHFQSSVKIPVAEVSLIRYQTKSIVGMANVKVCVVSVGVMLL